MRVLLINNYHYKRGGSETAYFDTAEILKAHGHEVAFFSTKDPRNVPTEWEKYFTDGSDYEDSSLGFWRKMRLAQKIIFNFQARKNLEKLIINFKPDIAHLHNIYHRLSPSVIYALKKHKIPTVMTLHDYKLISPNYNLFLDGKVWEKKNICSCLADRCVKNSYLKSAVCVLEKIVHDWLGSYDKIDSFISPSHFLIEKFKEFGFAKEIKWISNPVGMDFFKNNENKSDENGSLVYYGRISKEKGIEVAIRAMSFLGENEKILVVGDGPKKENLEKLAEKLDLHSRIEFLGRKQGEELKNILAEAKAIIIPSVWYENMPYVAAETLAMGKIVIASRIGGLSDLIEDGQNGFLFAPGDSWELAQKIIDLEKYDLEKIRIAARNSLTDCRSENYYRKLTELYQNFL